MVDPFVARALRKPGVVGRLLKRGDAENAIAAVEGLLAGCESASDVSAQQVDDAVALHARRSGARVSSGLAHLYQRFLAHCLSDKLLSDQEVDDLAHLKAILGLSDIVVEQLHNTLAEEIYAESVAEAVEDGRLDDDERAFLSTLRSTLRLPPEIAERVYAEAAKQRTQVAYDAALADQMLSPDEDAELTAIARSLDVEVRTDSGTQAALARARLQWAIQNGEIPVIDVSINLQKSEVCYFTAAVEWYEHRRRTKGIRYSGPTARVRIAKGLYWRAGQVALQRVTEEGLTKIDEGTFYLTSKRVIFMGHRGNKTVRLSSVLDFTPYRNGIDLQKSTGKSPFLAFDDDVDLCALMLDRALADT